MIPYIDNWTALLIAVFQEVDSDKALKMAGLPLQANNKKRRVWTAKDIEDIDKLKAQGLKWWEIADIYGVSVGTISRSWQYHKRRERKENGKV